MLEALNQATNETVHLVMLDRGDVVTIDRVEAEHPVALRTYIGAQTALPYCSAAGKAMLAYLPLEQVDRVLARGMPPRTTEHHHRAGRGSRPSCGRSPSAATPWTTRRTSKASGAQPRAVFNLEGRLAGGISLSAPAMPVDAERLRELAGMILRAARELSKLLGYQER